MEEPVLKAETEKAEQVTYIKSLFYWAPFREEKWWRFVIWLMEGWWAGHGPWANGKGYS